MLLSLLTTLIISSTVLKKGVLFHDSVNKAPVINGGVAVEIDFPQELYGEWKVASETIATNNPEHWGEIGLNFWTFERNGNQVVVRNPETGAVSSITVTQVSGNKVKFTKKNDDETKIEILEISFEGDRFTGTDQQIVKIKKGNEIYKTDVVKYRIVGKKINGTSMKEIFAK